jgi:hypothetical protein
MSGAPITVVCYRNGVDSYGRWISDRTTLERVRALADEGGKNLVEDVIWYNREPWTRAVTDAWPAVDTFQVSLALDTDGIPPAPTPTSPARKRKKKK